MNAPTEYYCPISLLIMVDPVICLPGGHTFERTEIEKCKENPLTRAKVTDMVPNLALKSLIDQYLKDHPEAQKDVYVVPQKPVDSSFDISTSDVVNLIQNPFRFVGLTEDIVTKRAVAVIVLSLYSNHNVAPDIGIDGYMTSGRIDNGIFEGDLVYIVTRNNRNFVCSTAVMRSCRGDQCIVDTYDNESGQQQLSVPRNNISFKRKTSSTHFAFFMNFEILDLFNTYTVVLDSLGVFRQFTYATALINDIICNDSQAGIRVRPEQNEHGEFIRPYIYNPRFGDIVYLSIFEEQHLGIVIEVNEQVVALWHKILICGEHGIKKITVSTTRMSFKRPGIFQEVNLMRLCGIAC
jgi:hypothetical protein